jgi:hypothetical protein
MSDGELAYMSAAEIADRVRRHLYLAIHPICIQ